MKTRNEKSLAGMDARRMEQLHPIQQAETANKEKPSTREVSDAVRELNPDKHSMNSRG